MGQQSKKVDAYIAKAAPFAQEILMHLRAVVHKACPGAEEEIKWSFPHFMYKGMLCSMAAFRQHCAFGFWKGSVMKDPHHVMQKKNRTAMGHFDRITSLADLPSDKILTSYIREAMKLNDEGVGILHRSGDRGHKKLVVPSYFMKALKKNTAALKTFEGFSNTNKKDYVEWITEARTDATREKRMATAIEWMAEGKIRNWKYAK